MARGRCLAWPPMCRVLAVPLPPARLPARGSHVKRSLHQSQGRKNSRFWQRPPFLVNIELFDFFIFFSCFMTG